LGILSPPYWGKFGVSKGENGNLVLALAMGSAETLEQVFKLDIPSVLGLLRGKQAVLCSTDWFSRTTEASVCRSVG